MVEGGGQKVEICIYFTKIKNETKLVCHESILIKLLFVCVCVCVSVTLKTWILAYFNF